MKQFARFLAYQGILAILLIGVAGCGLSDYVKRMDEQRRRMDEFDAVNNLLDDPLEMPKMLKPGSKEETIPAWPFEIYLRLPKGYGATPKDRLPYYSPFPFFRYAGGDVGYSFFVVAASVADAKEEFGVYYPKNFRIFVRLAVEDFYWKNYRAKIRLPDKVETRPVEVKQFTPLSGEVERMTYELAIYTDVSNKFRKEPVLFQAYFRKDGNKQMCIVVHRAAELPNESAFSKSMDACLGTLDMSSEAASRRTQFLALRRR